MTTKPDCRSAEATIHRALVGARVDKVEVDRALAHLADCEVCGPRFELASATAWKGREDQMQESAESGTAGERVEPRELFERALVAALSETDATARRRAAERLGGVECLGAAALAALAEAAAEDDDGEVRARALVALDRLDEEVSIPQRVIDAWSAAPAEAAPFIAGVLARLGGEGPLARRSITRLVAAAVKGHHQIELSGKEGIGGHLSVEENELWLRLNRMPAGLEKTRPVVALPAALAENAPPLEWAGKAPGLVAATAPVEAGELNVRLGRSSARKELFREIYLLNLSGAAREASGG